MIQDGGRSIGLQCSFGTCFMIVPNLLAIWEKSSVSHIDYVLPCFFTCISIGQNPAKAPDATCSNFQCAVFPIFSLLVADVALYRMQMWALAYWTSFLLLLLLFLIQVECAEDVIETSRSRTRSRHMARCSCDFAVHHQDMKTYNLMCHTDSKRIQDFIIPENACALPKQ